MSQDVGSVPFSVKKSAMGLPIVPHTPRPSPVFCLPQRSADFRTVTRASLLVIPCRGAHHPRSPSMAQTQDVLTLLGKSRMRGQAVLHTISGGQRDRRYSPDKTLSQGIGNGPLRL